MEILVQVQVHSHLLNYSTTIRKKKEEVKNRANYTLNSTGKKEECVAAKGAKLSSWLLPQSSYKRRLRSITLIKID